MFQKQIPFLYSLTFLVFLVLLTGCSGGIIVHTQSIATPECAKPGDPLTVRLFNDSQVEISNFYMETTGCRAHFGGLEQGETTCDIPVEPFYANFEYLIYITRANMWSNEFTREDTPDDNGKLITEGNYQISFKVEGKGHKLYLVYFKFEEV